MTVRISSMPPRMLAATPGARCSRLRARLRSSRFGLVGVIPFPRLTQRPGQAFSMPGRPYNELAQRGHPATAQTQHLESRDTLPHIHIGPQRMCGEGERCRR
jgi:hypothetical protein